MTATLLETPALVDTLTNCPVGITGRSNDVPPPQWQGLRDILIYLHNAGARDLHHGMCQGGDHAAHQIAVTLNDGMPRSNDRWQIHGHPGVNGRGEVWKRMPVDDPFEFATVELDRPFMDRNHVIVYRTRTLVALPRFPEGHGGSRRSGTWATVRMARRLGRQIIYVLPDGTITEKAPE